MLKKSWFLLLALLFVPIGAQAEEIDYPYYQGWVTSDGGTTVNDGWWMQTNQYEHNMQSGTTSFKYNDSKGQVRAIRELDNGAVAVIEWWYSSGGWHLDSARIIQVDSDTFTYCGEYDFEGGGSWYQADPRLRISRTWKKGQSATINIGPNQIVLTFIMKGLTVPSVALPSASSETDCALIFEREEETDEDGVTLGCFAPRKGYVWNFWYETSDTPAVQTRLEDLVEAWDTDNYPSFMTDSFDGNDIDDAMTELNNNVNINTSVETVPLTGGGVVVIPLN